MRLASSRRANLVAVIALCATALLAGCGGNANARGALADVRTFAIVGAVASGDLTSSRYDAIVLADQSAWNQSTIAALHATSGGSGHPKLVFALMGPAGEDVVDGIIALGFDGIFLRGLGSAAGDDRAHTIERVQALAQHAHSKRRGFAVVPLDASELITEPPFAETVDAIAQRSLWYLATLGGGDFRQTAGFRSALLPALRGAAAAGIPVFTIDFAAQPKDADSVYAQARVEHFIAYVTTKLDGDLTKTPPPNL